MIRKIEVVPSHILTRICFEVEFFDESLHTLVQDMRDTMNYNIGIGLAAPQVNVQQRVMLINRDGYTIPIINPTIVEKSKETSIIKEGCLSMPDYFVEVERPHKVTIKYQNVNGGFEKLTVSGRMSHVVQHEYDHLIGILISYYDTK